ncbi:acyltransferase family protein [Candidatus Symbiopectobacterium sp. NZEC135]|uniref:acyltransferase family protein n=1 Tax=Candidatus Symbiopectobacterium sp. NZEC135 TaxID=2820471 RepID=UPI002226FE39|nr:acyltransferase family protein [Candidatus Symbiopectobacterium sp. NZEC135]MCW2477571.1 acyltransferase [Candidatus Symbiopectobacterium sp. NZEC135]
MIRDVSQHALKSLSCFSAVTFYSASQLCVNECFINANAMSILYFLSTIAKPLFFILIGYFDNIDNLTKKEVRIKIKNVVFIIVFWNIILSLITFQYIQQGYILQNGIMLTIGIIYIIYPLIIKAMHNVKMTLAFFASLLAIIFLFDIFSPLDMRDDPLFIHSYSFIWVWGGYYIVGRMLGTAAGRLFTHRPGIIWLARIMVVPVGISMFFYERFLSTHTQNIVTPWLILEHLHLLTMCLALFIVFENITIKNKIITHVVEFIGPAMIGVYIVHYSVFYFISTLYDFNYVNLKFVLLVLVFIASVLLCRLLLLNRFTAKIISF